LAEGADVRTEAFDYHLPAELIAQEPVEPRDHSRLMVLERATGAIRHHRFYELPELLRAGDVLVRNNSRVVPARLRGQREETGGKWEGLFLRELEAGRWEILAKTRGRPRAGEVVVIGEGLRLRLGETLGEGKWAVEPMQEGSAVDLLGRHGEIPLPPYIRKGKAETRDLERYQTVYARDPGSVAAPTAGLHFTGELWERLRGRGIETAEVTLHVGIGTFRPIEVEEIEAHTMHAERAELAAGEAQRLRACRASRGRVVAIGTTSARTLETAARDSGEIGAFAGETAIYIRPGHEFRGIDGLLTNFHLPRSSLLVMVAAFAGLEKVKRAYEEAVGEGYRFYSYGDAMMIL
jgi:S-adenosylmethionine:tRNA ribosyltransferase-isomerase